MTAPKRCWPRFSLRTMFVVVTVFACWLGYEWNWIRQRNLFFAHNESLLEQRLNPGTMGFEPAPAPGLLGMFGEVGRTQINLYVESKQGEPLSESDKRYIQEAKRLFPEGDFHIVGGDRKRGWMAPAP